MFSGERVCPAHGLRDLAASGPRVKHAVQRTRPAPKKKIPASRRSALYNNCTALVKNKPGPAQQLHGPSSEKIRVRATLPSAPHAAKPCSRRGLSPAAPTCSDRPPRSPSPRRTTRGHEAYVRLCPSIFSLLSAMLCGAPSLFPENTPRFLTVERCVEARQASNIGAHSKTNYVS